MFPDTEKRQNAANVPFKELRPCAGMGAADVAAHGAVELFIETAEPM